MSASNTNIEKQKTRHRGPLFGMVVVVVWAGILLAGFLIWTAYQADNPTAESPAAYLGE